MAKVTLTFKDNSKGGVDLKYDSDSPPQIKSEATGLAGLAFRTVVDKCGAFRFRVGEICPHCRNGRLESYLKIKFKGDPGVPCLTCPECDSQY